MRHTFLLEEGNWRVKGQYFDAEGNKRTVDGETRVSRSPDAWTSEGELNIAGDVDTQLHNRYELAAMPDNTDYTTWSCVDPVEGTIVGAISVVDDCIISSFKADATDYHGVDVLRKAKDEYRSRGFAMRGATKLSSWVLTITKSNGKKIK